MKYCAVVLLCVLGAVILGTTRAQDCPVACSFDYSPVCGVDESGNQRTFSNSCAFNIENCQNPSSNLRVLKQGEC